MKTWIKITMGIVIGAIVTIVIFASAIAKFLTEVFTGFL